MSLPENFMKVELLPKPTCIRCFRTPDNIDEYIEAAKPEPSVILSAPPPYASPDDYVRKEEGTYNPENGHFLCTSCYIDAGMPSRPGGWVAP